jgi:uncharacterized membrane protein YGL010W
LLYSIELPWVVAGIPINVAMIIMLLVMVYYFTLSTSLSVGMLLFGLLCLWFCYLWEQYGFIKLWLFCILVFIAAWVVQFYGHKIEGKKPSFLKDIQFLMIGPAWLMSFIYKKLGIGL